MKWLRDYRMRLMLVGIVAAMVLGSRKAKADFIWTHKADMPTPRWFHSSAVVNDKIYVIGGVSSEPGAKYLSTVEEYDPVTDTWTTKADMPTARGYIPPSSPVVDGKIYVIGGGDELIWDLQVVEEYNPAADTWTRKADMPTPRWSLAAVTLDGKIYAIGGAPDSYTGLNVVEQYDPTTDTWTRKANIPTGLWALCANAVNGRIYAFGGRPGSTAISNMYEYDPSADTWTRKADMPVGTSHMASVVLDDRITVIGGWPVSITPPYATVQMYDPETGVWTKEADVPFLRACFSANVVNGTTYAMGGTDRPHPCPATSTVYEFGPLLDFSWDGIVDATDMCLLVDNWHTDNPLCDIAPSPFGDGIVDIQDLIVLADHLFEEILPVELIGHWKLDETEGDVAYDSATENDATVLGDAMWKPEAGQVEGALQFDGIDDYVQTPARILNPKDGVFSVLAWVMGGAPGQVVLSQTDGANWLGADSAEGNLMTGLVPPAGGRLTPAPLVSEATITDGNWHRIAFVWDGSHRALYVDDILVAEDEDTQPGLRWAVGGLHIGCGSDAAAGTFWAGLIDDVRVYKRAMSP